MRRGAILAMALAATLLDFGSARAEVVQQDGVRIGFDARLAPKQLPRDVYELVVIEEQYQGATPLDNPVLASLGVMPISHRRWMFVVLVGREFKTFDNAVAFARSVNVVVNVNDLPHFPAILKKGITDHVEFYRAFRQVLTDAGKR